MMGRKRLQLCHALVVTAAVVGACCVGGSDAVYAIPAGRHYEMVSPVVKAGFGATKIGAVVGDGENEKVGFYSAGIFNGAPSGGGNKLNYLASRDATGWTTTPLGVPASLSDFASEDISLDLSAELAVGPPSVHGYELHKEVDAWLRPTSLPDTPASWQPVTSIFASPGHDVSLTEVTASADLCHALLIPNKSERNSDSIEPVAEAEGTVEQLYQADRGCGGTAAGIHLVGVDNEGRMIDGSCHVNVGDQQYRPTGSDSFNAVSADGAEVFFTDCPAGEPQHQLYVRLGGTRTLEVSRALEAGAFGGCVGEGTAAPGEVPCAGAASRASADFTGASEDGSKVFFTAPLAVGQPELVPGDADASTNLYMATIGCPQSELGCAAFEREVRSLSEVSHASTGGTADVDGVLRVAPDGQRVYFVASGELLSPAQQQALEAEGRPLPQTGAVNLYVYDAGADAVSFVADLCTGREKSGTGEDFRCPSAKSDGALWMTGGETAGESQTGGPGGEFIVFSTYAQLTSEDTNAAKDVYRYDALTGVVVLVSHGEGGYEPNGSNAVLGAGIAQGHLTGNLLEQHESNTRAISEDGSRIVFTSAEPLSLSDSNGLVNAYEWRDGGVSLVSTGSDQEPVKEVVISPDGSSVAFDTVQGLVPQDTDGLPDVYVARTGGNFPQPAAERGPCEGDGCQGPLTNPAPLLVPGSVAQAPGESLPPPPKAVVKAKRKPACRRGLRRDKRGRCVTAKRARGKRGGTS